MSCDEQKPMLEALRSLRETLRSLPDEMRRSLGPIPTRGASALGGGAVEGGDGDGSVKQLPVGDNARDG